MNKCVYTCAASMLACVALGTAPAWAQTPALPQVFIDTTYPTQTGVTHVVHQGESIQAKINIAQPGDTIVLDAGATFTEAVVLKWKTNPDGKWIVIRTSSAMFDTGGAVPPGTRVNGADAAQVAQMAHLKSVGSNIPAIETEWSATNPHEVANYRLVGLDVTSGDTAHDLRTMIELGDSLATSNSARDIVVDRCYVHGLDAANLNFPHGITLHGQRMSVIDSYVSNFHSAFQPESQAVSGWNGAGPIKIVNNYLEATGEVILFGGADPKVTGLVTADMEVRGNLLTKRAEWNSPSYVVKNSFELKNARRVLLEGNILENSWPGAQFYAIMLTPTNQDGSCTWCTVEDVTIRYNLIRHSYGGVNILGHHANTATLQRVLITQNLFDDINEAYGVDTDGGGKFMIIQNNATDVQVTHNTILNKGDSILYLDAGTEAPGEPGATRLVYTDNLGVANVYGVMSSAGQGNAALTAFAPGAVFLENAIAGAPSSIYPAGNQYPTVAQFQAQFTSYNNGNGGDYHLVAGNIYAQAGNADIGADIDAVFAHINNPPPPPTETVILDDNFNDNTLNAAWIPNNVFSGATDLAVPVNETNAHIEIGPIPNQADGSTYNGIRTNPAAFTNGYTYVRVAQAASSTAYTMFTVGAGQNDFYRIFVNAGSLVCEKKIGGVKTALNSRTYDSAAHAFLRIEHNSSTGKVVFMAAPNNGGTPGQWTVLSNLETWDTTAVPLSSIMFELKAGVSNADASAGTAIFDDFHAARRQ